jgi:hypothetical protein
LKLSELKPNPFRPDIEWDEDRITELRASIKATGFWNGIVCRKGDGGYQLAYGHHRVEAAKRELGANAECSPQVRNLTDEDMVRMVGLENSEAYTHCFLTGTITTVQTVLSAYLAGSITLNVAAQTPKSSLSYVGPGQDRPYTTPSIDEFLRGSVRKTSIKIAVRAINLAREGHFNLESTRGLGYESVESALRVAEASRDKAEEDKKAAIAKAEAERKRHEELAKKAKDEKTREAQRKKAALEQAKIDKVKESASMKAAANATKACDDLREGSTTVEVVTNRAVKTSPKRQSLRKKAEKWGRSVENTGREDNEGFQAAKRVFTDREKRATAIECRRASKRWAERAKELEN